MRGQIYFGHKRKVKCINEVVIRSMYVIGSVFSYPVPSAAPDSVFARQGEVVGRAVCAVEASALSGEETV